MMHRCYDANTVKHGITIKNLSVATIGALQSKGKNQPARLLITH